MAQTNASLIATENKCEMSVYPKRDIAIVRGSGSIVWDADGKEYIDFTSGIGIAILGHSHPAQAAAISRQAATIMSVNESFANDERAKLLQRLAGLWQKATGASGRVFLSNSGAEANECAIKLARAKTGRKGFVACMNGFHGRTTGSLSLTFKPKYREKFEPLIGPITRVRLNDVEGLRAAVTDQTAAVFLEIIQGEGGIRPATAEYLKAARDICTQKGALLVFDEVQTGAGRTGRFFAFEHFGISPDIATLAKGLGGGVPIGATVASESACAFKFLEHGSTFGGNPLACAGANATLQAMEQEGILQLATDNGNWMMGRLRELQTRHPVIVDVRGRGLMLALELKAEANPILKALQAKGLLMLASGEMVIRMLPPLNTDRQVFERAISILDSVLP